MSWISRLARYHAGIDTVQFLQDIDVPVEAALGGRSTAIARLSELTGYDEDLILSHAVQRLRGQNVSGINGMEFSRTLIAAGIRFCPLCLAEDDEKETGNVPQRHGRIDWLFSTTRVCPIHCISLISHRVPSWEERIRDMRKHVRKSAETLRSIAQNMPTQSPSPLQTYVAGRWRGGSGPAWLDSQRVDFAIRAVQLLGSVMVFGVNKPLGKMSQEELIAAETEGWAWAVKGKLGIEEAFEILQRQSRMRRETGILTKAVFGQLYAAYAFAKRKGQEPMVDVLREHIRKTMDVRVGQIVLGTTIEEELVISAQRIAIENDLDPRTVRSVIVSKGLAPSEALDWPCSLIVVPAESADFIADQMSSATPLFEARSALNVSRPVMKILIDSGLIAPLCKAGNKTGKVSISIDRTEIQRFLNVIESISRPVKLVDSGWVTPAKAAEILRLRLARLIPLIFSGRLSHSIRLEQETGFGALRVNLDEMRDVLAQFPLEIPAARAFKMLGVSKITGNLLIQKGILNADAEPETGDLYLSEKEVARFSDRWLSSADLKRKLIYSKGKPTLYMSQMGIRPSLCQSDFKANFYDRLDLLRRGLIR
jgi:hypothetical protein